MIMNPKCPKLFKTIMSRSSPWNEYLKSRKCHPGPGKRMLKELLEEKQAIQYGEFTLTSGAKSSYYVNIKMAYTYPEVLKVIAVELSKYVEGYDKVAGMELGAVPIAVALSLETGLPFVMIRKEKRVHGTGSLIEGALDPGDRVLIVEDVVTSGGSTIKSVEALREAGAKVDTAVVVVDREEGGAEALNALEVRLKACITASQLKSG